MIYGLKQRLFARGYQRTWNNLRNRVSRRVTLRRLIRDLEILGLKQGDLVCVHSALNGIGYIPGGPKTLIQALRDRVGQNGTIVMPTFTGGNNTFAYVQSKPPPFDPSSTLCTTGALPEVFRKMPGTLRSLHPTHSVAAQGPLADKIIKGHENSITPFGPDTPYHYLVALKGKVLLLNTNGNSLLHMILEQVDWPNHYLDTHFSLAIIRDYRVMEILTAVHRPGLFSHVLLPGKTEGTLCPIHVPAYALPMNQVVSRSREFDYLHPSARQFLEERLQWLQETGIVHLGKIGFGYAAMIKASEFSEKIKDDLEHHLGLHRHSYVSVG